MDWMCERFWIVSTSMSWMTAHKYLPWRPFCRYWENKTSFFESSTMLGQLRLTKIDQDQTIHERKWLEPHINIIWSAREDTRVGIVPANQQEIPAGDGIRQNFTLYITAPWPRLVYANTTSLRSESSLIYLAWMILLERGESKRNRGDVNKIHLFKNRTHKR